MSDLVKRLKKMRAAGFTDAGDAILALEAQAAEIERLRAWVEEALSYVGCDAWSPSLRREGVALLGDAAKEKT